MDKVKRAQTAETPKQPSLGLKLRAPYLYPDRADSAIMAPKNGGSLSVVRDFETLSGAN